MTEPIKSGDRCLVISGLGQGKSPNVGQEVTVLSLQGEHSHYGRIWRCSGPDIKQLTDAGTYQFTGWADFAATWLEKIVPPKPKEQAEDRLVLIDAKQQLGDAKHCYDW